MVIVGKVDALPRLFCFVGRQRAGGRRAGSRRGVTARGSNPPAPSATYLLIVNPTVLCRAVILLGDRRIAAGTVRLSCPARERAAGATHRAVGFTINFCFRGMRDAFGVYCTEQHRRVSKVSSLLLAGSLWVRLTLSPACFVLWDARHACTPPRYAHFSPTSIRGSIPVSAQGNFMRPRMNGWRLLKARKLALGVKGADSGVPALGRDIAEAHHALRKMCKR